MGSNSSRDKENATGMTLAAIGGQTPYPQLFTLNSSLLMKILTAEQLREIDHLSSEKYGIPLSCGKNW